MNSEKTQASAMAVVKQVRATAKLAMIPALGPKIFSASAAKI
jgi:hypothetical protein